MKFHRNQLLIYAVTDRAWTKGRSLCGQVEEALKGGATMVQFREKGLDRGNYDQNGTPGIDRAFSCPADY